MSDHIEPSRSELDRKLDEILLMFKGQGADAPGVLNRLANIERLIVGEHGNYGMATKVAVMWRIHVWLLCSLSGSGGIIIGWFAKNIISRL